MAETQKKKSVDYPFLITLIFVIAIGGYWIIRGIGSHNLDPYMDYLGEKLLAVLPEDKDKEKVQTLYEEFKENVRDNKIPPEEVGEVAAGILNMHNLPDSVAVLHAEELLAAVIPRPERLSTLPPKRERRIREEVPALETEKWRELGEKLGTIYEFENQLQEEKLNDKLKYRIDKDLQVIIDARKNEELIKTNEKKLIVTLKNLEKEKLLVWSEDVVENFQHQLDSIAVVIDSFADSIRIKRIKVPEFHMRTMPDSISEHEVRSPQRVRNFRK